MIYLGVDQSYTSSGLVIIEGDAIIHFETYKTNKDDDVFDRSWNISGYIATLVAKYNVDAVSIEGLAFGTMGNATRDLAGLQHMIVNRVRHETKAPITVVTPLSLKKFALGQGKGSKKEIIAALPDDVVAAFKADGYKLTTGLADLTDAYFLAQYLRKINLNDHVSNKT